MKQNIRQDSQQNKTQNIMQSMDQNIPDGIMREVEKILDDRFKDFNKGLGFCHIYWYHKKELLRERGYSWLSPADLDPNAIYD